MLGTEKHKRRQNGIYSGIFGTVIAAVCMSISLTVFANCTIADCVPALALAVVLGVIAGLLVYRIDSKVIEKCCEIIERLFAAFIMSSLLTLCIEAFAYVGLLALGVDLLESYIAIAIILVLGLVLGISLAFAEPSSSGRVEYYPPSQTPVEETLQSCIECGGIGRRDGSYCNRCGGNGKVMRY